MRTTQECLPLAPNPPEIPKVKASNLLSLIDLDLTPNS
jgi:hypothetical protein